WLISDGVISAASQPLSSRLASHWFPSPGPVAPVPPDAPGSPTYNIASPSLDARNGSADLVSEGPLPFSPGLACPFSKGVGGGYGSRKGCGDTSSSAR